ncbi:MAG: UpxY family transcription antiterminator [Prevotellaceae bacterium]|nr:UpxY family transcription antiterminator [Candidatus Minthosoma caballi]
MEEKKAIDIIEERDIQHLDSHWYIAVVQNRDEQNCAERLQRQGYESYVAVQKRTTVWKDGRRKERTTVVIPAKVFVRATEQQRSQEIVKLPYIKRFFTNISGRTNEFNRHPVAIIPDAQFQSFRLMLERSETPVTIEERPSFKLGDQVTIIQGSLKGLSGTVVKSPNGKMRLYIQVESLGYASVEVEAANIEKVSN